MYFPSSSSAHYSCYAIIVVLNSGVYKKKRKHTCGREMRYSLSPVGRPSASLRDANRLDDLEDGRTAHDEEEQR